MSSTTNRRGGSGTSTTSFHGRGYRSCGGHGQVRYCVGRDLRTCGTSRITSCPDYSCTDYRGPVKVR